LHFLIKKCNKKIKIKKKTGIEQTHIIVCKSIKAFSSSVAGKNICKKIKGNTIDIKKLENITVIQ
jgi:hypothetical protein